MHAYTWIYLQSDTHTPVRKHLNKLTSTPPFAAWLPQYWNSFFAVPGFSCR